MLSFLAGMAYGNAGEWIMHKYVLHEIGRKRDSFWSFHWKDHHKNVRRNGFRDPDYDAGFKLDSTLTKEAALLLGAAAAHLPLFPLAPGFTLGVWTPIALYFAIHTKSHLDPEWAKKYVPWHYDHHMGKDQDANWCITYPLADYVMGTRVEYLKNGEAELKLAG